MAFQIGSIRRGPAGLHASPYFIMERWLCVFILLGAFWAKEHITSSLCFIVFSKLINGKHSGKNRYENVYFALLKSPSTKGYQQLLWYNLWNVIRVRVRESSTDKAASAIMDFLITFCFPLKLILSEVNLHDILHFCFSYHGATCELNWVCNKANFQITFWTCRYLILAMIYLFKAVQIQNITYSWCCLHECEHKRGLKNTKLNEEYFECRISCHLKAKQNCKLAKLCFYMIGCNLICTNLFFNKHLDQWVPKLGLRPHYGSQKIQFGVLRWLPETQTYLKINFNCQSLRRIGLTDRHKELKRERKKRLNQNKKLACSNNSKQN